MAAVPATFWEIVTAIGTAAATMVAALSAYLAVKMPSRIRLVERSERTYEILEATREILVIFVAARKATQTGSADEIARLAVRARYLVGALDRLVARDSLTDGAIITALGAKTIGEAIEDEERRRKRPNANVAFARFHKSKLGDYDLAAEETRERAQKVAKHAVKRKWPEHKKRFSGFAKDGAFPSLPTPPAPPATPPAT